jgi:hypothetical protein
LEFGNGGWEFDAWQSADFRSQAALYLEALEFTTGEQFPQDAWVRRKEGGNGITGTRKRIQAGPKSAFASCFQSKKRKLNAIVPRSAVPS